MMPAGNNEGRSAPEGTLTVGQYVEGFFLPYTKAELKASTANGYSNLWKGYIKPHVQTITMRDFRCVDATKTLVAIHRKHRLSKKSLRHCKGLLSSIFTHAKQNGAIDGANPVMDAGIPRAAKAGVPTHAYTSQEIIAMLNALTGVARTAIALMYFSGLRPGEARGIRWTDFDADKGLLKVRVSIWRKHETTPKTEESCGVVPVAGALAEILSELRHTSEFILVGPSGKPVDLHNLAARIVVPTLERCAVCKESASDHAKAEHKFQRDASLPAWRGWYACRRGLATAVSDLDTALAAKSLLRHSNVATTNAFYIKSVDSAAVSDSVRWGGGGCFSSFVYNSF
jgi:integrase